MKEGEGGEGEDGEREGGMDRRSGRKVVGWMLEGRYGN